MVTHETIAILVDLLDGWQKLLLDETQRGLFLAWLCAHTRLEFEPETFKEQLSNWLSGFEEPQEFYADVLVIHSEIIWISAQRGLK